MRIEHGVINLTGVATGTYVSGTTIDVSRNSENGYFNLWSLITGDTGGPGSASGVSIIWEGNWITDGTSGSTYWITPTNTSFIRTSGTSVNGPKSNGMDSATFSPDIFPFIRIKARHGGSGTTSTAKVNYALITD